MPARKTKKRGDQAALIRRLMQATGLSDEACRKNLLNKTRPRNPLVAAAWDRAISEPAAGSEA
jgi:hypothetical protein